MYKNYIFDLYGTLADIRTDEDSPLLWEKMSRMYGTYGAKYRPRELRRCYHKLIREQEQKIFTEYAEINLTNVFALLYNKKGVPCGEDLARMTALVFRTSSRSLLTLYDGVLDLLEELKARGRKIYLLSNAQADFTRPELVQLGIENYFDGIFLSSECGVKKPSELFFGKMMQTCGLLPGESVMIGNDELSDIAGANRVGMDSLYIHSDISPRETGRAEATYRVMDGDFRKIRDLIVGE